MWFYLGDIEGRRKREEEEVEGGINLYYEGTGPM
jgi:hypothetical protein